jgi:hypothetical protein
MIPTGFFYISYASLWLLVVFQFLVCFGLLRQIGRLKGMPKPALLPIGSRMPAFSGTDFHTGDHISKDSYLGKALVILLIRSSCPTCLRFLASLDQHGDELGFVLAIVCSREDEGCKALKRADGSQIRVLVDLDSDLHDLLGLAGSPAAVFLDSEGRIRGYGNPSNIAELRKLFVEIIDASVPGYAEHSFAGAAVM